MTEAPSHIAVIRTDRLGDMVLTLPMFPVLRQRFPNAQLTLITRTYARPLVHDVSDIDHVLYLDQHNVPLDSLLRSQNIDTVFFPRPRLSEVWSALRAGVKKRIGSGFRWYSLLFTTRIS